MGLHLGGYWCLNLSPEPCLEGRREEPTQQETKAQCLSRLCTAPPQVFSASSTSSAQSCLTYFCQELLVNYLFSGGRPGWKSCSVIEGSSRMTSQARVRSRRPQGHSGRGLFGRTEALLSGWPHHGHYSPRVSCEDQEGWSRSLACFWFKVTLGLV